MANASQLPEWTPDSGIPPPPQPTAAPAWRPRTEAEWVASDQRLVPFNERPPVFGSQGNMFGNGGNGYGYQSRLTLSDTKLDTFMAEHNLVQHQKEASEVENMFRQPGMKLTPEGEQLRKEWRNDQQIINEMGSRGYRMPQIVQHMGEGLNKFRARWGDGSQMIQREKTPDEQLAERLVERNGQLFLNSGERNGVPSWRHVSIKPEDAPMPAYSSDWQSQQQPAAPQPGMPQPGTQPGMPQPVVPQFQLQPPGTMVQPSQMQPVAPQAVVPQVAPQQPGTPQPQPNVRQRPALPPAGHAAWNGGLVGPGLPGPNQRWLPHPYTGEPILNDWDAHANNGKGEFRENSDAQKHRLAIDAAAEKAKEKAAERNSTERKLARAKIMRDEIEHRVKRDIDDLRKAVVLSRKPGDEPSEGDLIRAMPDGYEEEIRTKHTADVKREMEADDADKAAPPAGPPAATATPAAGQGSFIQTAITAARGGNADAQKALNEAGIKWQ